MKRIILLGPQASGKSTQGELITEYLGIKEVAAGDILRKAIEDGTPLGKQIEPLVDSGALISNDLMNQLMFEELQKEDYHRCFMLDGYPRNLYQVVALEKLYTIDLVIHIHISDEEAIKRIGGRRICDNGHVFHLKFNPPKKEGICDDCGEELYQRDDDKEEAVKRRLSIYHDQTEKVLEYYKEQGKVQSFDGLQSIEEIWAEIKEYLDKHVGQKDC